MISKWLRLGLWVSLALHGTALAQGGSGTLSRFAASETPEDDFHLSRPSDLGHVRFGVQLHADYANDPLVWEERGGDRATETHRIVSDQLNLNLGLSFGLFDRVVVFAGLPFTAMMDGEAPTSTITAQADDPGLGDAYLGLRLRLFGESQDLFAMGLQVTGTFPTAGDQAFRGDEFLSIHPELLAQIGSNTSVRFVLNVGARFRENVTDSTSNLAFSDELTFGAGVVVPVWRSDVAQHAHLDLHAQVYGTTSFEDFFGRGGTPVEAIGGVKYFHASGVTFGVAGGPGLARGFGSPDFRVVGMLGYVMPPEGAESEAVGDRDGDGVLDNVDGCPDEPEDVDGFQDEDGCPDPDNDQDGVLDADDQCPNEAEDRDNFEDQDGCPDPDNDQDGILDVDDQCPNEPEDTDGFQDQDGCPEADNDQDGLPDNVDGCPNEAGPMENRGCPDSDRDSDTVVDRLDNCPDEPGTPENHGCRAQQQVRIEQGRLEILDMVYFRTNRDVIQSRSFALLRNVAAVLNAHPEIERIRVEGHTDARGNHDRNVDLSRRRAASVVTFLVREGIAAERLESEGYGPDRPIVADATSPEDHARNRRVEFNIVGGAGAIQQTNSGPGADTIDH